MDSLENIKNKLVIQANSLIKTSYKFKPSQQKFLKVMASMINKDDENFKLYKFKISQLIKLFEIKDQSKYTEIAKQTRKLMGNVLTFKNDKKLIQVPFLNYCEYEFGEGILGVQFHPYLKPFYIFLGKENPYTKYELKNILQLRSVYSIRIYELLKQFEKVGNRIIDLNKLRELFQIESEKYKKYNDFKRFVLLQSQKELKEKTDISFDFEEIKTGRKVTSCIRFYIYPNKLDYKKEFNAPKEEMSITLEQNSNLSEDAKIFELYNLFKEHKIGFDSIKKILKNAN